MQHVEADVSVAASELFLSPFYFKSCCFSSPGFISGLPGTWRSRDASVSVLLPQIPWISCFFLTCMALTERRQITKM